MDKELYYFLNDLIIFLQEKYNETVDADPNESPEDLAFRDGQNLAYYDALNLIESQLTNMDYDLKFFKKITPMLGKKIE